MATIQTDELSLRDLFRPKPQGASEDLSLPALFLVAASLILGLQNPINFGFQAHVRLTLGLALVGAAILAFGMRTRKPLLFYVGSAWLLATVTLGVITQPTQFGTPAVTVWPLRILLLLLVGSAWAFLMRPPDWMRRALFAIAIPSVFVLALWGGPATAARIMGWNINIRPSNFAPYWLALDSHGTLYATDADGNLIWVFDPAGNVVGTINPSLMPPSPTPGPGIIPVGYTGRVDLPGAAPLATATPGINTSQYGLTSSFTFCGIATDPRDNLYTVDATITGAAKVLRFDRNGDVTASWPAPAGYDPTRGCVAADADHVYIASRQGQVYAFDQTGRVTNEWAVHYQPFGLATAGKGKIEIMGPNLLNTIDVSAGTVITSPLPAPQGELQIPYQAMLVDKDGTTLVTDLGGNKLLRLDSTSGNLLSTLGEPGYNPGQFKGLGGITRDASGRLYVADWQHRVIQRFSPEGKIEAVWWAHHLGNEVEGGEENE